MTDIHASLDQLTAYKAGGFITGYPIDRRTFFSPVDDVPSVLRTVIGAATKSITLAIYGFDDEELVAILLQKIKDPNINVDIILDKSQAGGTHEKALLAQFREQAPMASITIGNSEKHAIMHLKMGVIDGVLTLNGSTNWSVSGETKQDNQLTIDLNPYVALETLHRIQSIRLAMTSTATTKKADPAKD